MQNISVSRVRCDPTRPFVEIQARRRQAEQIKIAQRREERIEVHLGWDLANRMWVLKGERQHRQCSLEGGVVGGARNWRK